MEINEVEYKQIERLEPNQLVHLIHKLINLELEASSIEFSITSYSIPHNIYSKDEGSDGYINLDGSLPTNSIFPASYTVFQCKAENISPSKCSKEILKKRSKDKPTLKDEIEELVKRKGGYMLLTTKGLASNAIKKRIDAIHESIVSCGHHDFPKQNIRVIDANKLVDWSNKYISAVTYVHNCNGITDVGFLTWQQLDDRNGTTPYHSDSVIEKNLGHIINSIEAGHICRINGQSGLGKTRLVLEAFRNSTLRKQVVYYDMSDDNTNSGLIKYIRSHQEHQSGIIIVDNCDIKDHNKLTSLVEYGKLRVISIGWEGDVQEGQPYIKLDRNNQHDIVKKVIEDRLSSSHQPADIDYLTMLCEGYPGMAKHFCDSVVRFGINNFSVSLKGTRYLETLLFNRESEDYEVIKICSVFSAFAFPDPKIQHILPNAELDDIKNQIEFIRKEFLNESVTYDKFYSICIRYKDRELIEKKGVYYIVRPTVLAIHLATQWLRETPPDKIIRLLSLMQEHPLGVAMVKRIKDLDQVDTAADIAKEMFGIQGFFATAEVLNTSWGSLLFRYIVDVNPKALVNSLEFIYAGKNREELLQVDNGRRNLVWSLEKLCFRKETFLQAVKLMYLFADAENETWGNNASGQLVGLFQIHLPGTEASLRERLEVLKWGLGKKNDNFIRLVISCIARALPLSQYSRSGGAEKQGSQAPLKDYNPTSQEIYEYLVECLNILISIISQGGANSELAIKQLAKSARMLINIHQYKLVIDAIDRAKPYVSGIWIEMINELKVSLSYEKHIGDEARQKIKDVIEILSPIDLKGMLYMKITNAEWLDYEERSSGEYIDKAKINAENLAVTIVNHKLSIEDHLGDLVIGDQRQAYSFGVKLGELHPKAKELLKSSIELLKFVAVESQNSQLTAGLMMGINDRDLMGKTIDEFIRDPRIQSHAFFLTNMSVPPLEWMLKLFVLVDSKSISVKYFSTFQYGRALNHLSVEEVLTLCEKVAEYDKLGGWTALSLFYMYSWKQEDIIDKGKEFIIKLLSKFNFSLANDLDERLDGYHWSDTICKILNSGKEKEFACTIANQILEFCQSSTFNYSYESYIRSILELLFTQYPTAIWPIVQQGLIADWSTYFNLKILVGGRNHSFHGYIGIMFKSIDDETEFLDWIGNNLPLAAKRVAEFMPLEDYQANEIVWHPVSKKIIERFGDNDEFLKSLGANMGTYGTFGSSVPYFQKQKQLLDQLKGHESQKVKNWCLQMSTYTENMTEIEKMNDEQRYVE